jgi:hypothetical protein
MSHRPAVLRQVCVLNSGTGYLCWNLVKLQDYIKLTNKKIRDKDAHPSVAVII